MHREKNHPDDKPSTLFFSDTYGDIYFNNQNPEAEKSFVFIEGNRLGSRLPVAASFTVAELGFGFGVNCALAIAAAIEAGVAGRFSFFSVEEFFPSEEMTRALVPLLSHSRAAYLELWRQRAVLVAGEPVTVLGARVKIFSGKVEDFLTHADFRADAWFLDGFSPAKNPAMWSEPVVRRVYDLANAGATFATYTSAGWVRRNLEAAGFSVQRVPGYSGKREMLTGSKQ